VWQKGTSQGIYLFSHDAGTVDSNQLFRTLAC